MWEPHLLVINENLESAYNLYQRDTFVCLPALGGFWVLDKDDEVIILSLIVNFG